MLSDEGLERRTRVHVRDRHQPVDVDDRIEGVPRLLDGVQVGHVGHRAAGIQVRQHDLLVVGGEDVGRLGHEVHAAEHDVGGPVVGGRQPGETERVAPGVGPAHDLVPLVVVAQDEQAVAEGGLGRLDARRQVVRRGAGVPLGERRLHPEHVGIPL